MNLGDVYKCKMIFSEFTGFVSSIDEFYVSFINLNNCKSRVFAQNVVQTSGVFHLIKSVYHPITKQPLSQDDLKLLYPEYYL